jgi:hypothetical protein
VTIIGAGTCMVHAYQPGTKNYLGVPVAPRTFTIARAKPKLSWASPAGILAGTPLGTNQLDAKATFQGKTLGGTLRYIPRSGTVLPVGDNQPISVTFTPADSADFAVVSLTTSILVVQAIPQVVLNRLPNRTYGDSPFRLGVTGNLAHTITTYVARGACRNGGSDGSIVTITGAGVCTVYAYQPGTKDYLGVPVAPRSFTIGKARPKVNWPSPAPIRASIPLGKAQLNATATFQGKALNGSFTYSPKAGTKLHAGRQTLYVTFTPHDGKNFIKVAVSITVQVG